MATVTQAAAAVYRRRGTVLVPTEEESAIEMGSRADALFDAVAAEAVMSPLRRPSATYRLQMHGGFPFDNATDVVDYLAELGISDVYCSPYLAARPGSTHGYDVVDHTRLNPRSAMT